MRGLDADRTGLNWVGNLVGVSFRALFNGLALLEANRAPLTEFSELRTAVTLESMVEEVMVVAPI